LPGDITETLALLPAALTRVRIGLDPKNGLAIPTSIWTGWNGTGKHEATPKAIGKTSDISNQHLYSGRANIEYIGRNQPYFVTIGIGYQTLLQKSIAGDEQLAAPTWRAFQKRVSGAIDFENWSYGPGRTVLSQEVPLVNAAPSLPV
jgi:hypothetical protein